MDQGNPFNLQALLDTWPDFGTMIVHPQHEEGWGTNISVRKHGSIQIFLPISVEVYGTVFHMNQGNPFSLQALVDTWPDFSTVVIRPQQQEMTDDLDHYTNTYQVFSKDVRKCQEVLASPEVISWNQHLQIQSTQSSLNQVIQSLAAAKSLQVQHSQNILFMWAETVRKLAPALLEGKSLAPTGGKPKAINEALFRPSALDVAYAALVDQFWLFGGNEQSRRFIERCIRTFPSFCLLGPEGTPVSWALMDQSGEMRMGATVPDYQGLGLIAHIMYTQAQALSKLGFPLYMHMDRRNKVSQKVEISLPYIPMPCDWNQWHCVPL
ncbi:PREDICTED: glycine N-acyltransferase-like [Condylura cristata]|uniref:glycine N-acyltransferase-like n=1 Tax=Condylura cristata TaxID=143302 RepID=UPI0003343FCA|nr:PREDICTED: glycine N-acyltransferase-like [Condylura cristata]